MSNTSKLREAAFSESIWAYQEAHIFYYPGDEFFDKDYPLVLKNIESLKNLVFLSDAEIPTFVNLNDWGILGLKSPYLWEFNNGVPIPSLFNAKLWLVHSKLKANFKDAGTRAMLEPYLLGDPSLYGRIDGH